MCSRNNFIQQQGATLPKFRKTGTTIVGVCYKVTPREHPPGCSQHLTRDPEGWRGPRRRHPRHRWLNGVWRALVRHWVSRAVEQVCDKNCEKIHYLAPNIYCCGAGTAADTEKTTGERTAAAKKIVLTHSPTQI